MLERNNADVVIAITNWVTGVLGPANAIHVSTTNNSNSLSTSY
jgi:hypothetical protein